MKRKLVQHGPSTLIVSLPNGWVKKFALKKGDEVDIEEKANKLLISTDSTSKEISGSFDFSDYPLFLVDRMIARIYEAGYDKVKITYNSDEQLKQIEKRMTELMGFEIIESSKNTIMIQNISSDKALDFDNTLRKAFLVMNGMFDMFIDCLKKKDFKSMDDIILEDLKINKFTYYCLRLLNRHLRGDAEEYVLFYLAKSLEDLGDSLKRLIRDVQKAKKVDDAELDIIISIRDFFRLSYDFFYKPKAKTVVESLKLKDEIFARIHSKKDMKMDADKCSLYIDLSEIARIIYHFSTLRLHTLAEQ